MKKLLRKIRPGKKQAQTNTPDTNTLRITNETVAEHRERILASGRKFKYPYQYPRHRIVLITVMIVVFAVVSFFGFCTWQLYAAQNTDKFMHNLTQVLPFPVAKVDGKFVRYSDYLLNLRSSLHYLSTKDAVNFSTEDGKRQAEYQKRLALDKVIQNTYVAKLAKEQNIAVSQQEVDDFISKAISNSNLGVTDTVYRQVIRDYYDWSFDEYKRTVSEQLLRKKVIAKVDTDGRQKIETTLKSIQDGAAFDQVAKDQSEDAAAKATGGDVGIVAKNTEDPSGIMAAALALQPGQVSPVIEGTDGFYIVKLIESNEDSVRFAKIFVSYKAFGQKLADLKNNKKIEEYIKVQENIAPTNQ